MELKRRTAPDVARTLATCLVLIGMGCTCARANAPSEYQVKAAFLYNFAKFVEWPEDSSGHPFVIGILGEDSFGGELDAAVRDKTIAGRPVVVRRIATADAARNCQVLFISRSEQKRLHPIFDSLKGSAVLTVGETEGFAASGGIINFIIENDQVRFEVNVDAAGAARLRISSKLLNLSRIVKGS